MGLAWLLYFLAPLSSPAAIEVRGSIFYELADAGAPTYFFRSLETIEHGIKSIENFYTDKSGAVLAKEEGEFEGDRLMRYSYRQTQVSESGEAQIEGNRISMSFSSQGATKTDHEDFDSALAIGPMIPGFLQKNWDALMREETLKVRYLVIERLETIGFKFFKEGERTIRGHSVVDIVMKPSSIFIAALVSPIHIFMTKEEPHRLVETNGRTPIRVPEKMPPLTRRDWTAIDARIEYEIPKEWNPAKPWKKAGVPTQPRPEFPRAPRPHR